MKWGQAGQGCTPVACERIKDETIHFQVLASQSPSAQKLAGLLTGEDTSLQNIYRYAALRTSTRF